VSPSAAAGRLTGRPPSLGKTGNAMCSTAVVFLWPAGVTTPALPPGPGYTPGSPGNTLEKPDSIPALPPVPTLSDPTIMLSRLCTVCAMCTVCTVCTVLHCTAYHRAQYSAMHPVGLLDCVTPPFPYPLYYPALHCTALHCKQRPLRPVTAKSGCGKCLAILVSLTWNPK
jgi:hypothetical protein